MGLNEGLGGGFRSRKVAAAAADGGERESQTGAERDEAAQTMHDVLLVGVRTHAENQALSLI
jgi:hypothetical protein